MGIHITSPATSEEWTYLKSASCTASNTLEVTALPAYEFYMFVGQNQAGSAATNIGMTFNNDNGANYAHNTMSNTVVAQTTGATYLSVFTHGATNTLNKSVWVGYVNGVSKATASGLLMGVVMNSAKECSFSSFQWVAGNGVQLTSVKWTGLAASTFTGKVDVYGRNSR